MTLKEIAKEFPADFNRHKDQIKALLSLARQRPENKGKNDQDVNITGADIDAMLSSSAPEKKDYDISYTTWSGSQKINDAEQLVMQINKGSKLDSIIDPELLEFLEKLSEVSYRSGHPVLRGKTIGWLRVDFASPDLLIVDEIQSDLLQTLSQLASGKSMAGLSESQQQELTQKYPPEKMKELFKKVNKEMGDWFIEALTTLMEFCRKNNIKRIALHTEESAALVPGKSFITSTYWAAAKRLGFGKETIEYGKGKKAPFYVREAKFSPAEQLKQVSIQL